jgi:hypothetical protein
MNHPELKQVRFCNGHAFNITKMKQHVRDIIKSIEEYQIGLHENYQNLNENHIPILCKYPFQWSFIPKGMPYFIYISGFNGNRCTYFIERNFKKDKSTRIFMMEDIFINTPSETIMEGYVVPKNNEKTQNGKKKWSFILRDIILCSGQHLNSQYYKRWQLMVEYLENANTQNKTLHWRVLPLLDFPVSINILNNIEIQEDIPIRSVIFHNMSKGEKRYKPFVVDYNPNIKNEKEELDINKKYTMTYIPGVLPDVYHLKYNDCQIGIACVRTLKQSIYMRNNTSGIFQFNPMMEKWELCDID